MDAASTVIQLNAGALITLVIAIACMVFAFGRVLLSQFEKRVAERFTADAEARQLQQAADAEARRLQRQADTARFGSLEKNLAAIDGDLKKLHTDLPLHYVRREDWIRFSATIDTKLDRLHDKFDLIRDQRGKADA